ncbi:MAG: hypothetical protein ACFFE4_23440 [Candidatus Thorarchaeota archaeon]
MQLRAYVTNMGGPNGSDKGINFTSVIARKLKCPLGSQIDHSTEETSNDCGGKDLR